MTAQYSIGEFAKLTGLSTYTLRYYEKEKLITLLVIIMNAVSTRNTTLSGSGSCSI